MAAFFSRLLERKKSTTMDHYSHRKHRSKPYPNPNIELKRTLSLNFEPSLKPTSRFIRFSH